MNPDKGVESLAYDPGAGLFFVGIQGTSTVHALSLSDSTGPLTGAAAEPTADAEADADADVLRSAFCSYPMWGIPQVCRRSDKMVDGGLVVGCRRILIDLWHTCKRLRLTSVNGRGQA